MARETPLSIKPKKKGKGKITNSSPQPVLHLPRGYVRTAKGVRKAAHEDVLLAGWGKMRERLWEGGCVAIPTSGNGGGCTGSLGL